MRTSRTRSRSRPSSSRRPCVTRCTCSTAARRPTAPRPRSSSMPIGPPSSPTSPCTSPASAWPQTTRTCTRSRASPASRPRPSPASGRTGWRVSTRARSTRPRCTTASRSPRSSTSKTSASSTRARAVSRRSRARPRSPAESRSTRRAGSWRRGTPSAPPASPSSPSAGGNCGARRASGRSRCATGTRSSTTWAAAARASPSSTSSRPTGRRLVLRVETGADHVCRVTLKRPEAKNALTVEMRDQLVEAVRAARADADVRALLITGTGDACGAGMDLGASTVAQAGREGFDTRATAEALRVGVQAFIRELWELDKPTVAAVNGVAVGPGAHLALACDFVLVHNATRFLWSFARWGLVVDAGGAYLLPRLVGLPRAKAMVMLGEGCTGAEAVELGLAYRCLEPDELEAEASALAARLAAGPTRVLGLSKRLLNESFETDLAESLEREAAYQSLATTSGDLVEGMAAFKERRDPRFTGR